MILGIHITSGMLIAGGGFLSSLVVFQILVGLRKIHFKGKLHMRVHKALAWLMLAGALAHGTLAFVFFGAL